MRVRYKVFAALAVLIAMFLFGRYYHRALTKPAIPVKLPVTEKERIVVNPVKHTIIIITPTKTTTETLPDRESVIDIGKDDNVKITAPQYGLEAKLFVYAGYSNALRFGTGVDGAYFKKLDLGVGVAGGSGTNTVVFAQLSYNVFDNVRLGITLDHQEHVGVGVSIRI